MTAWNRALSLKCERAHNFLTWFYMCVYFKIEAYIFHFSITHLYKMLLGMLFVVLMVSL